jgi:hypothetical protein
MGYYWTGCSIHPYNDQVESDYSKYLDFEEICGSTSLQKENIVSEIYPNPSTTLVNIEKKIIQYCRISFEVLMEFQFVVNPPQLNGDYFEDKVNMGGETGSEFIIKFIKHLIEIDFFSNVSNSLIVSCFHPVLSDIRSALSNTELEIYDHMIKNVPLNMSSRLLELDASIYDISKIGNMYSLNLNFVAIK